MLFLGESDHRRFPLMSLQFAVHCSPFAVAGCHLIGRISPIPGLLERFKPADNATPTPNSQLQTVNCEL
jgi:hypothetical protein